MKIKDINPKFDLSNNSIKLGIYHFKYDQSKRQSIENCR